MERIELSFTITSSEVEETETEEKIPINTNNTSIEETKHPKQEANMNLKKAFILFFVNY